MSEGGAIKTWGDYRYWLDQPLEVSLETFAKCNAACTFCPYPTLERIGTRMSDEIIMNIVDQMAKFGQGFYFSPFKVNEPLLDKRVLPLLETVIERIPHCVPRLFSNGSTLTDRNVDDIAALKRLDCLWISLNDYREAEYEKLMGLKWKQVTDNIDRLHSREGFPHRIVLSCVGYPNEEFRRYCFDRWPKFEAFAIKRDAWIDFTHAQNEEVPDSPCSRWWELNIMANGVVAHCCMDGKGAYPIGDANKESLLEIYNKPFWRERRERLLSRRTLDDRSPCAKCTY